MPPRKYEIRALIRVGPVGLCLKDEKLYLRFRVLYMHLRTEVRGVTNILERQQKIILVVLQQLKK